MLLGKNDTKSILLTFIDTLINSRHYDEFHKLIYIYNYFKSQENTWKLCATRYATFKTILLLVYNYSLKNRSPERFIISAIEYSVNEDVISHIYFL